MSGSKFLKRLLRWGLVVLLLAVAAGVALYVTASWMPGQYRPADLSSRERNAAAKEFVEEPLAEFARRVQVPQPFSISISQDQFNAYLASVDEIAALAPNGKPGEVRAQMERAGVSRPSVALGEGVLTLMAELSEYGKVVSADLSFDFQSDGKLQIRLREVRVGRLTVPRSLVSGLIRTFQQSLTPGPRSASGGDDSLRNVTVHDVSALVAKVVASIDEKPISTELPRKVAGRKIRVAAIELHDGKLTLRIGPVSPTAPSPPR
jgi:hypothetical protein